MQTTKHTHQVIFGRKATEGGNSIATTQAEASRLADIKAHDCKKSGCGVVCTAFDW